MNYKIKTKEIQFVTNQIIEIELPTLCKIIELKWKNTDIELVYMERWGSTPTPLLTHKLVILDPDKQFEYTECYEPVFSRRGKLVLADKTYYVFMVS